MKRREEDFRLRQELKRAREELPISSFQNILKKGHKSIPVNSLVPNVKSVKGKLCEFKILAVQYDLLCFNRNTPG